MNNWDILQIVSFIAEGKGRKRVTPAAFNRLLKTSSLKLFKTKLGLPEEYQPGMPLPTEGYEITQRITDELRRFKVEQSPTTVNTDGYADIPTDYFHHGSFIFPYYTESATHFRNVDVVTDHEWSKNVGSEVCAPNKFFPVANYIGDKIRFSPKDLGRVNYVYIRRPLDPVLAVTNASGYYEYDSSNSVELEWDDVDKLSVINFILLDLGISLERQDIEQYAERRKAQGV